MHSARATAMEKVANRNGWDFGWEIAHAAVSRRPPISLYMVVASTHMYTHPASVGICPSFKDHFCRPVPNLNVYDSQRLHRCMYR